MIAAVDVHYRDDVAVAAAVAFRDWAEPSVAWERVVRVPGVAAYRPGHFFERELPPVLAVLEGQAFEVVVVDGYVWLGADRKGLGAHVHEALGKPVVGVAKTRFAGAPGVAVRRGNAVRPLYVTAAGLDAERAASGVRAMWGPYRLPEHLKRVDRLCRGG